MSKGYPVSPATKAYNEIASRWDLGRLNGAETTAADCERLGRDARLIIESFYGRLTAREYREYLRIRSFGKGGATTAPDIVWAARWHECRHVYQIDGDLADILADQGLEEQLPTTALGMLPYPIIYVNHPVDNPYPDGPRAKGFAVWTDRLGLDDPTPALGITYFLDGDSPQSRLNVTIPLIEGENLKDVVSGIVNNDIKFQSRHEASLGATRPATVPTVFSDTRFSQTLNLILFVNSKEAEPEVVYQPTRGVKLGKKTNRETVVRVGSRLGHEIGAAKRALELEGQGKPSGHDGETGRTMVSHLRKGHWHGYWTGQRKGRTDGRFGDDFELHWLSPIVVHGEGFEELETVHAEPRAERGDEEPDGIDVLDSSAQAAAEDLNADRAGERAARDSGER